MTCFAFASVVIRKIIESCLHVQLLGKGIGSRCSSFAPCLLLIAQGAARTEKIFYKFQISGMLFAVPVERNDKYLFVMNRTREDEGGK